MLDEYSAVGNCLNIAPRLFETTWYAWAQLTEVDSGVKVACRMPVSRVVVRRTCENGKLAARLYVMCTSLQTLNRCLYFLFYMCIHL